MKFFGNFVFQVRFFALTVLWSITAEYFCYLYQVLENGKIKKQSNFFELFGQIAQVMLTKRDSH